MTERDVSDFVSSIARSDTVAVSPAIREAVLDQLEYDLSLTLYQFERRRIRNSELLQLLRTVADSNKFSVATYVREAIIAEHDRRVTEDLLRKLSEKTSHREWYYGAAEKRTTGLGAASAITNHGRGARADIELLATQL